MTNAEEEHDHRFHRMRGHCQRSKDLSPGPFLNELALGAVLARAVDVAVVAGETLEVAEAAVA